MRGWLSVFVLGFFSMTASAVTLDQGIPHQVARLGEPFSLQIPADAFDGPVSSYQVEILRRDPSGQAPALLNDFFWQRDLSHHWLSFSNDSFGGTPQNYDDLQTLQLLVTATGPDSSTAQASFLLVVVDGSGPLKAPASTEAECAHVIGNGETGYVDAQTLGVQPGDSICLRGGVTTGGLTLVNLQGTAARPIYVLNVDGPAQTEASGLSYTLQVNDSNHFKLLGAGSPSNPYGWRISGDTGPGVQIKFCYEDIEVAWLEISDTGFAGLSMKNDGEQRPTGDMQDVRAHDLYIHETGTDGNTQPANSGEALYCGIGDWSAGTHSIKRLRVHHIIGHDLAWDALQIKNTDDRDALVERNFLRGYGIGDAGNTGAHDEGLFAGEGSTGVFRYNWIEDAFGPSANGIQFYGAGETLFHHNVIVNLSPGTLGRFPVYGARDGYLPDAANQRLRFLHNTFVGFGGLNDSTELIRVFTDIGSIISANNLFVEVQGSDIAGEAGGNVIVADRNSVFRDASSRDLTPSRLSTAASSGLALAELSVDLLGRALPPESISSGAIQAPIVIFADSFEPLP